MATEHIKLGHIKKPCENKRSALSETRVDEPLPLPATAQVELYSDMRRMRTGIQEGNHLPFRNVVKVRP